MNGPGGFERGEWKGGGSVYQDIEACSRVRLSIGLPVGPVRSLESSFGVVGELCAFTTGGVGYDYGLNVGACE